MKLLWLTPEVPQRVGSGGAIRSYHQLHGLSSRGVELVVVAPAYPSQVASTDELRRQGIDLRLALRPESKAEEAAAALARSPRLLGAAIRDPWLGAQAAVFWRGMRPATSRALAEQQFDGVVIEHDFASVWAGDLPRGLPVGLVFHNAYWKVYEQSGTARGRLEARRFRSYVMRHARRLSRGWAVSEPDREDVRRLLPGLDVDVIPNGVDAARLASIDGNPDPGVLLFTGTLDYAPNADAVRWFVAEVLPLVRARNREARLIVVGRNPPADVLALAREGEVEVTGWVDDLTPYQRAASVAVAPLRFGGGTKLKVLEALAAGRPLVATSVAAAGIAIADGQHLLVRDDAASFAAAVSELLENDARASELGAAGREAVATRYDWNTLADQMHLSLRRWLP